MANRFAVPTHKTLARYRASRDAAMAKARHAYDNRTADARAVSAMVREALEWQRKVMWARRALRAEVSA
jgi:hypothetical protein